MQIEIFDLPVLSKKNRLKFGRGRTYKDQVVVDFERDLKDAIFSHWRGAPLQNDVSVSIEVTVPDRRRRDLQNFSDTICDTMNEIVYTDDSQIVDLKMRKIYGNRWCLRISVEPYVERYTTIFSNPIGDSPCNLH